MSGWDLFFEALAKKKAEERLREMIAQLGGANPGVPPVRPVSAAPPTGAAAPPPAISATPATSWANDSESWFNPQIAALGQHRSAAARDILAASTGVPDMQPGMTPAQTFPYQAPGASSPAGPGQASVPGQPMGAAPSLAQQLQIYKVLTDVGLDPSKLPVVAQWMGWGGAYNRLANDPYGQAAMVQGKAPAGPYRQNQWGQWNANTGEGTWSPQMGAQVGATQALGAQRQTASQFPILLKGDTKPYVGYLDDQGRQQVRRDADGNPVPWVEAPKQFAPRSPFNQMRNPLDQFNEWARVMGDSRARRNFEERYQTTLEDFQRTGQVGIAIPGQGGGQQAAPSRQVDPGQRQQWIDEARKAGYTEEQIQQELQRQGL